MTERIPIHRRTPGWVERELTHSRHVIANAKVVVTFSAALAATFASAALDPNEETGWDEWAVALMFFTLVVTVVVIFLRAKHHRGELDDDPARKLASCAYWLMLLQVGLSIATIAAAVVAKRQGK
jgi:cytochrome bd-type quinol oxidase subunit 2